MFLQLLVSLQSDCWLLVILQLQIWYSVLVCFWQLLWQEAMPWFQCEDVIQTYYISSFKLLFLIFYGLLGCTTFLMVQKSQPTIWHVCNPANDGMFFISTGQPEFFPSTLSFAEILKRPTHIKLRVDFHLWSPTTKKNYIPRDIKSISSLHHLIFKENLGGGVTCVLVSPLLWFHEWRLKKTLTIRPMVDRISHCWWSNAGGEVF